MFFPGNLISYVSLVTLLILLPHQDCMCRMVTSLVYTVSICLTLSDIAFVLLSGSRVIERHEVYPKGKNIEGGNEVVWIIKLSNTASF